MVRPTTPATQGPKIQMCPGEFQDPRQRSQPQLPNATTPPVVYPELRTMLSGVNSDTKEGRVCARLWAGAWPRGRQGNSSQYWGE